MKLFILLLAMTPLACSGDIFLEAEDARLVGLSVSNADAGFSGSGYVTGFDGDADELIFEFDAKAGLYELMIGYATPFGEKGYTLQVNDSKTSGMFPEATKNFTQCRAGKYLLNAGRNTVIIGKGWGWFHIDYIRLVETRIEAPQKPPKTLSNPASSASARSLFAYLVDQFGISVLAGQQDMNEIEYVHSITSRTPAIGAFDLMDYSPSRIEFGANPGQSVEEWIRWAKSGNAVISLCWHWNAPTDLINQPGKEWYRGFYSNATTFDIETALADTASMRYKLIIRDFDAIAGQLEKMRQNDIPVLWRPLHEASGRWFWWGAKGPESFKKLWRLMYDRFTRRHNLDHLIWVYTAGDPLWYPGDDCVDVVSLDVYTDASSSMSNEWETVFADFNGRKLIALSESGTLPDPDKIRVYGVWWSWFSVWNGSFIHDVDKNTLKRVYDDADIITLNELPDWRHHGSVDEENGGDVSVSLFPNPASATAIVRIVLPASENAAFELYNVLGQRLVQHNYGRLSPGVHDLELNCGTLAPGIYWIRIRTGSRTCSKKVTVLE